MLLIFTTHLFDMAWLNQLPRCIRVMQAQHKLEKLELLICLYKAQTRANVIEQNHALLVELERQNRRRRLAMR